MRQAAPDEGEIPFADHLLGRFDIAGKTAAVFNQDIGDLILFLDERGDITCPDRAVGDDNIRFTEPFHIFLKQPEVFIHPSADIPLFHLRPPEITRTDHFQRTLDVHRCSLRPDDLIDGVAGQSEHPVDQDIDPEITVMQGLRMVLEKTASIGQIPGRQNQNFLFVFQLNGF